MRSRKSKLKTITIMSILLCALLMINCGITGTGLRVSAEETEEEGSAQTEAAVSYWNWVMQLGQSSSGVIQESSPYIDSMRGGFLIDLGAYDITDLTGIVLSLGLKSYTDNVTLLVDCVISDYDTWTVSSNITCNVSTLSAYDRDYAGQVSGGTTLASFTAGGGSSWSSADYSCEITLPEGMEGTHELYLRVEASDGGSGTWAGNLYRIILDGAVACSDDIESGDIEDSGDTGETGDMESSEETEGSENTDDQLFPAELDQSIKIGESVSFDNLDLFGATYGESSTENTSLLNGWEWVIYSGGQNGSVSEEGVFDSCNVGYIICLGEMDLTYLDSITVNMGLKTGYTISVEFIADYSLSVSLDEWEETAYLTNNSGKAVYDRTCVNYCTGGTVFDTGSFSGSTSDWSQSGYIVDVTVPANMTGVHTLYVKMTTSGWAGNLSSIDLNWREYTANGSNLTMTVAKDGTEISSEEQAALNMTLSDDIFSWNTLSMESGNAGTYVITFDSADDPLVSRDVTIQVEANRSYLHPGILFTEESLVKIYENYQAGIDPWKSAGEELLAEENVIKSAEGTYELLGYDTVVEQRNTVWTDTSSVANREFGFNNLFRTDCMVVYQDTLAYVLTHDISYAKTAIDILNQYSALSPAIGGHDAVFVAGQMAFRLCNAAEILRTVTDEDGSLLWEDADILNFKMWLLEDFVPWIEDIGMANGGACAMKGMLAVGIFCDSDVIYDIAVDAFFNNEYVGVTNAINEFGQNRESGRDQIHAQLLLGHLAEFAWVAYNQDPSLGCFEYGDNRILTGYEYMAKYLSGEDVPYDESFYSTNYTYSSVISSSNRGELLPIYEFVYNYYVNIAGMDSSELPYTTQAAVFTRNEAVYSLNGNYDTYHNIGYGTITCSQIELPDQVSDVTYETTSGGLVTFSWSAAENAVGYNIYRSNQTVSSTDPADYPEMWFSKVNEDPVTDTSFTDDGLVAGCYYIYKISSVDADGNESGCCDEVVVTGHESAPETAPTWITTDTVNSDIIRIDWESVSGASGYYVYVSTDGENYTLLSDTLITDTWCYHCGMEEAEAYYYKVSAVNDYGESQKSEVVGVYTAVTSATGSGMGYIANYPMTAEAAVVADASVDSNGNVYADNSSNYVAYDSCVSFLKIDLTGISISEGEEITEALLVIRRAGSYSEITIDWIESETIDYDTWYEEFEEDGYTMKSFDLGYLIYGLDQDALTSLGTCQKASADGKVYSNAASGSGIDILEAVKGDTDGYVTLMISSSSANSSMAFYSLNCGTDYAPVVTLTITNESVQSAIEAYEAQSHTHTYGTPEYAWSENHTSCTATFTCTDCGAQTVMRSSDVSSVVSTDAGGKTMTIYTVTFTFQSEEYETSVSVESVGGRDTQEDEDKQNSGASAEDEDSTDSETSSRETINVDEGSAEAFEMNEDTVDETETAQSPATGDNASMIIWAVAAMIAMTGALSITVFRRKKDLR